MDSKRVQIKATRTYTAKEGCRGRREKRIDWQFASRTSSGTVIHAAFFFHPVSVRGSYAKVIKADPPRRISTVHAIKHWSRQRRVRARVEVRFHLRKCVRALSERVLTSLSAIDTFVWFLEQPESRRVSKSAASDRRIYRRTD